MRKLLTGAVLAIGLAAAPLAGASTASASVHPNATPACGFDCSNLFSEQLGSGSIMAVFVPNSNGQAVTAKVGDKTDLKFGNDSYTNEDFTLSVNDTLGDACPAVNQTQPDLLSYNSYACLQLRMGNFGSTDPVIEDNWSPNGDESGLCPGVPGTASAGALVTLQDCGDGPQTLWVLDDNDAHVIGGTSYVPIVLGSDPESSQPLVLQVNTGSKNPGNVLRVERDSLLSHGFVPNQNMWSAYNGPAL